MIDYSAFSEEYVSIKEAALGELLTHGAGAIRGMARSAKRGWNGWRSAGGKKGITGATNAVKNYWNTLGKTQAGRSMQTGAKVIGTGAAVGAGGIAAGKLMG